MTSERQEQRQHSRLKVECPVSFFTRSGELVAKGKSLDMSDGGTYVSVPAKAVDRIKGRVNLTFSIPRSTENTYMLEDFACQADVIRQKPLADKKLAGVAIAFTSPMDLSLEV